MKSLSKVSIITGPTACGKSDYALQLYQKEHVAIINADCLQLYRDLPILTAHPEDTKILPHYLFGVLEPEDNADAAWWYNQSTLKAQELLSQGVQPVFVGGTGFYIKTLLQGGLANIPKISESVQKKVRFLSHTALISEVKKKDSAVLNTIHENDVQRLQRALAVRLETGESILDFYKQQSKNSLFSFDLKVLLPQRQKLYNIIDERLLNMVKRGVIEEVQTLYSQYPDLLSLPIAKALGVYEIVSYIKGEISKDVMFSKIQTITHQYAKRQYTWFKNQFLGKNLTNVSVIEVEL